MRLRKRRPTSRIEKTLFFMLGELPFITGLYEKARAELEDDENLSVDGVKELLITARDRYKKDLKKQARPITPQLLVAVPAVCSQPVADRAPADAGPV